MNIVVRYIIAVLVTLVMCNLAVGIAQILGDMVVSHAGWPAIATMAVAGSLFCIAAVVCVLEIAGGLPYANKHMDNE